MGTFGLKGNDKECAILGLLNFTPVYEGVSKDLYPTTKASLHEYPRLSKDSVVVLEASNKEIEIIVKGSSGVKSNYRQSTLSSSSQSKQEQEQVKIKVET